MEGGIFNFAYFKINKDSDGLMHLITSIIGQNDDPRASSISSEP